MKKYLSALALLCTLALTANVTHASHESLSASQKTVTVDKSKWTDAQRKEALRLQNEIDEHIRDYYKIVEKAYNKAYEDKWLKFPTKWNPDDLGEDVEKDIRNNKDVVAILGKKDTYFKGSVFEEQAKKLRDEYGVVLHYDLPLVSWEIQNDKPVMVQQRLLGQASDVKVVANKDAVAVVVASPGLFTKTMIDDYGDCNVHGVKEAMQKKAKDSEGNDTTPIGSPNITAVNGEPVLLLEKKTASGDGEGDKIGDGLTPTVGKLLDSFTGTLFGTNCDGNSLSAVSQFTNISRPLNLSNNPFIMKLVHITQQIAFTMGIIIIAFYALMFTTGFQNMDPIKFAIRLFFCLLAVQYLPWLMQDILNLNNLVVYNLSTLTFDFNGISGNSTDILMGAFVALWEGLLTAGIAKYLLILLFVFVMAIVALAPLFKIIMWWYLRLLRIFLGAIVGPLLVMLAALPQTAEIASKWLERLIGSVFQQIFMTLGLLMVAVIIGNIGDFGSVIDIGWFGKAILIYAAIFFLSDIPDFSDGLLKGFKGGKEKTYAGNMSKEFQHYSGVSAVRKAAGKTVDKAVKNKTKAGLNAVSKNFSGETKKVGKAGIAGDAMTAGAVAGTKGKHAKPGVVGGLIHKSETGKEAFEKGKNISGAYLQGAAGKATNPQGKAEKIAAKIGGSQRQTSIYASKKANDMKQGTKVLFQKAQDKVNQTGEKAVSKTMRTMYQQSQFGKGANGKATRVYEMNARNAVVLGNVLKGSKPPFKGTKSTSSSPTTVKNNTNRTSTATTPPNGPSTVTPSPSVTPHKSAKHNSPSPTSVTGPQPKNQPPATSSTTPHKSAKHSSPSPSATPQRNSPSTVTPPSSATPHKSTKHVPSTSTSHQPSVTPPSSTTPHRSSRHTPHSSTPTPPPTSSSSRSSRSERSEHRPSFEDTRPSSNRHTESRSEPYNNKSNPKATNEPPAKPTRSDRNNKSKNNKPTDTDKKRK